MDVIYGCPLTKLEENPREIGTLIKVPRDTVKVCNAPMRVERLKENQFTLYRAVHLVGQLGWVDFDLGCSTICPVFLG